MQFLSYLNERGNDGPMAIILTHARIKDAQGKCDILFTDFESLTPIQEIHFFSLLFMVAAV